MKPASFHDDRNDAVNYVRRMRLYFMAYKSRFPNEVSKISAFLLGCQGDKSKSWAGEVLDEFFEDEDTPEAEKMTGWRPAYEKLSDVTKKFLEDWQPFQEKVQALSSLDALIQGSVNIDDHIVNFKTLLSRAGIKPDNEYAVQLFRKSLCPALLDDVERINPPPESLSEYIAGARQRDQRFRIRQEEKRRWGGGEVGKAASSAPKSQEGAKREYKPPMAKIGKLTDAERDELSRTGACFYCRLTGHRRENCPTAPPRPAGYVPATRGSQTGAQASAPVKQLSVRALLDALREKPAEEIEKAAEELKAAGF